MLEWRSFVEFVLPIGSQVLEASGVGFDGAEARVVHRRTMFTAWTRRSQCLRPFRFIRGGFSRKWDLLSMEDLEEPI